MYVLEQESIQPSFRRDTWDLRRRMAVALQARSRGVPRRLRSDLQRRFAAAWVWVREEQAVGLLERVVERGGFDRGTLSAERRRGVDHLLFLAGLLFPVGSGFTDAALPMGSGASANALPLPTGAAQVGTCVGPAGETSTR